MGTLASELVLDLAGFIAMVLAYLRPSDRKRTVEEKAISSRVARQADRDYVSVRPWVKTVFMTALIGFVVGGFLVSVVPIANDQEGLVLVGLIIQAICVVVMATNQVFRGRAIRDAVRACMSEDTPKE
jgi:hypothetical protein